MKLILDENMPATVARLLREHGHDVLAVKESMRYSGTEFSANGRRPEPIQ